MVQGSDPAGFAEGKNQDGPHFSGRRKNAKENRVREPSQRDNHRKPMPRSSGAWFMAWVSSQ